MYNKLSVPRLDILYTPIVIRSLKGSLTFPLWGSLTFSSLKVHSYVVLKETLQIRYRLALGQTDADSIVVRKLPRL